MTADDFRKMALGFPETAEASHMQHPDFRVRGKIFATLAPDNVTGMVKLTAAEQTAFVQAAPKTFYPAAGAWGRRGCTMVTLTRARKSLVKEALLAAWRNTAPPSHVREATDNELSF